jgi:DNA-binding NarL/FixJ family response regulator
MEAPEQDHPQLRSRALAAAARGDASSPRRPISVLVADDHPIVREHLSRVIDADGRLAVAAEAGDGLEALRLAEELRPEAVVLDVDMPGLDGAGVMRGLHTARLESRVLIFTGHADPKPLREVMGLQPDSLMYKEEGSSAISDEIVAMVREEPSVGRLRRESAQAGVQSGPTLTERERVVLAFAAQGRTVDDLAARLNVSHRTAKERRHDLCKRFGATSILGVVATAMRLGLLD